MKRRQKISVFNNLLTKTSYHADRINPAIVFRKTWLQSMGSVPRFSSVSENRGNIFWETTKRRVSYHVFLPEDGFLLKIPNVPLKRHPVPFTRTSDAADPRAVLRVHSLQRERKRQTDTRYVRCELVKVPNPRGYRSFEAGEREREREREREKENRVCHGPIDSINGNNATSVRRFIGDAIELRFSSPFFESRPSSALFYLVSSSIIPLLVGHLLPHARSNCQSSCNDLEKASFERSRLVESAWRRTLGHVTRYVCTCVVYLVANALSRAGNQRNSAGQWEN